jgi:hypothetical protein
MRSGVAIRTRYAPVERAKKASSARTTSVGGTGGVSTASPSGQARSGSGRLRETAREPKLKRTQDDATIAGPRNYSADKRFAEPGVC